MARIGLVAGEGKIPLVFARAAKNKGDTVIAFGLKGVTDPELERHVHKMHWLEWGKWHKAVMLLPIERIKKIVMLGKLKKEVVFKLDNKLDEETKTIFDHLGDKKDYSILDKVGEQLGKFGVEILDSTVYLKDLIPSAGVLTEKKPAKAEWDDIDYAKGVAKGLSGFDIGQTVVVKDKTIIAVEAMEGTDETIARAGALVKSGFVVVKVARPKQDMRFDVPLVGLETLKALIKAGGRVLALEADKTLIMDKDELVKLADEKGVSVVVISQR
ncbi:MAG: UDP-2,3-diacylglucosamine diphosphatase LpxI [Candidatus Omnitrophota bacterium]|nr:UDP-2,3-diacylglucosamine diphosphatase LpxI [Candidatus Omnitrophota bacterium]